MSVNIALRSRALSLGNQAPPFWPDWLLRRQIAGGQVSQPFDGVFFDTANDDSFANRFAWTPDATLSVSDGSVAFASATQVTKDITLKDDKGNALYHCFDYFEVDATYSLQTGFSTTGNGLVQTGMQSNNNLLYMFAGELYSHPTSANRVLGRLFLNSTPRVTAGTYAMTGTSIIRSRLVREGNLLKHIVTWPNAVSDTLSKTMVLGTSDALPTMLQLPIVRFMRGSMTLTDLKVSALYPNARFGFIGDSLTQGAHAGNYTDPFPQKVRADYPGDVIVCGAPAATTTHWLAATRAFCQMKPATAFVLLGANDFSAGASEATVEANLTKIRDRLIAAGIRPVILTPTPMNNTKATNVGTWIKAQGWEYIDVYSLLVGTGNALNPVYNSENGDGLHLNTAGHAVIYNAVKSYVSAQGL